MDNVYLGYPNKKEKIPLNVGTRFAGGAAGDIHLLPDAPGHVLKIYKTTDDRRLATA